jgi:ATP-dependent exoDNAse (exonuclease V) alpha subunit
MQKDDSEAVMKIVSDDTWMPFEKLPAAIEDPDPKANLALFRYPESRDGKRLARARKQEALESALKPWVRRFCKGNVEDILNLSRQARILCTEYDGVFGVDNINLTVRKLLGHGSTQGTFEGEQVMIVKNMTVLNLFNGDSGIIAERDGELCFVKDDSESVPFRLIPSDCIVTAYASTIHKAQGSGYDNVLLFLPENKRSLLATRQIAYTGITRVKGGTLYIVGSSDRFNACYANPTIRDTGIDLSQQHS